MRRRPTPLTALVGLALTASVLPALTATPASAVAPANSTVFVNEIHYDNTGTDVGEFVEVAGPAGTDLTGWSVVLYNGNGGAVYDTDPLPTTIPAAGVVVLDYPSNGIQNGSPDGVALVDAAGTVVQFLSYEGVLTASNGPAVGLTSTDIGVTEAGTEPAGQSLQLTGTGSTYGDFTWTGPAEATKGAANTGQVFQAPGAPAAPVATCPSALTTSVGEATSAPVSAQDADSGIAAAAISSAPTVGISLDGFTPSAAGEPATATLTVASSTAAGDYPVEITFSTDGAPAQTTTCTVDVTVQAPPPLALISAVQGSGATSPRVGERLSIEAVVTTLKSKNDAVVSYFLQEQDVDADGDPATSEGLLVLCGAQCPTGLAAGDLVRATGVVEEAFGMTRLDASDPTTGSSAVLGKAATPTAAVVNLPAATSVRDAATFENVEGMLVRIPDELTVSEYFNLARFGELLLTAGGRPAQFTEDNAPSEVGNAAYQAELDTRRIVLDDGSEDQNDAISGPMDNEPYPFPSGGLSVDNRFRGGDTITGLTGVLEYGFDTYRVQPVASFDYDFASANPRTAAPEPVGGRLKVTAFNVLNYFADTDTTASTCGPSGTLDCRGADSEAERERQLAKIVAAIRTIDADVVGLVEIQNDAGTSTEQIVEALNAATAPGTYDYLRTGTIGTDAIKQALLYQPAAVRPVGDFATLTSAQDARFDDTRSRPALIQTFAERGTGHRVTVAVNHFKSKGSGCGAGDDATDGSGNCDGTRTRAAQALADFLATDPTGSGDPDFLIIGDLNSYQQERPVTTLESAGYTDLGERFGGDDAYSFVFNGQLGALDYALANTSLNGQVSGATTWHINADEPSLLDYNDTVQDPGEAFFERKSTALPLYAPDAYRSSDHDPVVVGLDLAPTPLQTGPFRLTLLHNNDGESSLLPSAPRGGIARFGTLVEQLRDQAIAEPGDSDSLLVSSGDNFLAGPQLQASLENYDGDIDYSDDGPFFDARALDFLDYDASAVGNHEFDFGPNTLGYFFSQFKESNIRFVSANLDVTGEPALEQFVRTPPGEPGTLVEWTRTQSAGRQVAIVGATTPRLQSISSPGNARAQDNVREAVQQAINEATADGTSIVVLISHLQNITEDQALISQLRGLDIAVAGGGDELLANADDLLLPGATADPNLPYPLRQADADGRNVPIVTTQGSYGYLGRLIVDVDAAGEITAIDDRSGPVRNVFDAANPPADQKTPDPFLLENVERPVADFVAGLRAEVVARTEPQLDGRSASVRTRETNLGSLFTDGLRIAAEQESAAFRTSTRPKVGLTNAGGLRNSVVLGPDADISRFDTFQVAPFSNFVAVTQDLSPDKLKQLLERAVSAGVTDGALQAEGRFAQVSGLTFRYDPAQTAQQVTRQDDGTVVITTAGQRVRDVTLTLNTPDPADDIALVRNGVLVPGAPSVDLATNSFTIANGDNFPFNLAEGEFTILGTTYQGAFEAYLRQLQTVTRAQYPEGGLGRIVVGADQVATPGPTGTPTPGPTGTPTPGPTGTPTPGPTGTPTPGPTGTPTPTPTGTPGFDRLSGLDRWATAAGIAIRTFGSSDTVLLANGREDHLPDALAGNYLAGFEDAPILLTDDGGVPAVTQSALEALGATRVIILGGTDAVSAEQETALEARYVVERVGGLDRYETARLIALEPGPGNVNAATAVIARGDAFPDALVAGPIAFRSQFPILLVRPDGIGSATSAALNILGIEAVIIAGGTDAVSEATAEQVRDNGHDALATTRVAGVNRQETAVAMARFATAELGFGRLHVNLVNGGRAVDALTGGPHAGREGSVILLTENSNELGVAAEEYLAAASSTLEGGHFFGGTEALSDALVGAATDAAD